MKIRAVLPPFLPLDEIEARVRPLVPDIDIVSEPLAPGRHRPEEVEVLILTTFNQLPADVVAKLGALKFVQVASTGYNTVDLSACRARGIMVSNIPVANSKTVAEHVIMVTLVLLRDLLTIDREMRKGEWPMLSGANDLAGKVVGIVGMGRIGREVAARLVPFEASTIYTDAVPLSEADEQALGATRVELPELLKSADVISLHLPATPETTGMIGEAQFAMMKEGVIVVNAARAEILDHAALCKAVGSGRVRAALDVFPTEPADPHDPIFALPGTVFTPHQAGVTLEAQTRFLQETIKNVLRYTQGKDPLYRVDGGARPATAP